MSAAIADAVLRSYSALCGERARRSREADSAATPRTPARAQSHARVGRGCFLRVPGVRTGPDRDRHGVRSGLQASRHSASSPRLREGAPDEVQKFIQRQITSIGSASRAGVSITLLIAVAIALWSASGGMAALVTGVNVARDQTEPKSFVKKRSKALALTFGAVALLVVMMFLIAAVPSILTHAGLGTAGRVVFNILRWPLLAIVIVLGLGVLYRVAVEQPKQARFGLVTPGTLVATLRWLTASGLLPLRRLKPFRRVLCTNLLLGAWPSPQMPSWYGDDCGLPRCAAHRMRARRRSVRGSI